MIARDARFEVVRGDSGWWARFRAANGRIVWTTETFVRRIAAVRAVELITGGKVYETPHNERHEVTWAGSREWPTEVWFLDERTVTK